jgi:hypothetical protein
MVAILHDMLQEGLDPSSRLIGLVQGLSAGTSLSDGALLTALNMVFTDGPYNGSTLHVFGRARLGMVMERPIIGGTSTFLVARGYMLSKKVESADPSNLIVLSTTPTSDTSIELCPVCSVVCFLQLSVVVCSKIYTLKKYFLLFTTHILFYSISFLNHIRFLYFKFILYINYYSYLIIFSTTNSFSLILTSTTIKFYSIFHNSISNYLIIIS